MKVFYSFLLFLLPTIAFSQIDQGLADALQATLDENRAELNAVGLGAAVVMPSDDVWEGVSGRSADGTDLTTEFTFGVGSVTKSITSAIIAQLHVDGVLSLDDPISKWIPTFDNVDGSATVRQCLNHTTGIFDYRADTTLFVTVLGDSRKVWTPEEILNTFVHAPNFAPGERWSYSNTNYVIAGMVIKAATGREYYELYKEMLFEPLGMTSAITAPFEQGNQPLADLWFDIFVPGIPSNVSSFFSTDGMFSIGSSAGAVVSTPKDIAIWMKALVTGNAISDAAFEEMKKFIPVDTGGYGLGLTSGSFRGESVLGHSGNIVYISEVFYFPDLDISISVHSNDGTQLEIDPITEEVESLILPILGDLMETVKNFETSAVAEITDQQNISIYPNPVSDFINLDFELEESSNVNVSVFDILGKKVNTLYTGKLPTGKHQQQFNLDVVNGTYLIKLELGDNTFVERVVKY